MEEQRLKSRKETGLLQDNINLLYVYREYFYYMIDTTKGKITFNDKYKFDNINKITIFIKSHVKIKFDSVTKDTSYKVLKLFDNISYYKIIDIIEKSINKNILSISDLEQFVKINKGKRYKKSEKPKNYRLYTLSEFFSEPEIKNKIKINENSSKINFKNTIDNNINEQLYENLFINTNFLDLCKSTF